MPVFVYDLIAVALLVCFALSGYHKGFFLTVCNFLAMFVAFFGAIFVAMYFSEPISNILAPIFETPIASLMTSSSSDLASALAELESSTLWGGFVDKMDLGFQSSIPSAAALIADFVALQFTRIVLFLIGFLVVMTAWFMLSRTANLAFHLPILSDINALAGLVAGLLQGALMVFIMVWILDYGILSAAEFQSTFLLHYFYDTSPLALLESLIA